MRSNRIWGVFTRYYNSQLTPFFYMLVSCSFHSTWHRFSFVSMLGGCRILTSSFHNRLSKQRSSPRHHASRKVEQRPTKCIPARKDEQRQLEDTLYTYDWIYMTMYILHKKLTEGVEFLTLLASVCHGYLLFDLFCHSLRSKPLLKPFNHAVLLMPQNNKASPHAMLFLSNPEVTSDKISFATNNFLSHLRL